MNVNVFDNQELLTLIIISLILITFMWDSVSERRNQRLVFVKDERVEREQDKFTNFIPSIMERVCRLFLSKSNFVFFYLLV